MTSNVSNPQQTVPKGTPPRYAEVSPQTLEALRASEARYRGLFENSNDAMTMITLDGTFLSLNRAFEALLGWPREELRGRHYSLVATPATLVQWDERTRPYTNIYVTSRKVAL
jgi:PAS domain-containing protein